MHRRNYTRMVWTLVLGFVLGGLFTLLAGELPDGSAAQTFLTTAVDASVGPLSVGLVAIDITVGPVTIYVNVCTLVGIGIVAFIARSWI